MDAEGNLDDGMLEEDFYKVDPDTAEDLITGREIDAEPEDAGYVAEEVYKFTPRGIIAGNQHLPEARKEITIRDILLGYEEQKYQN